MNADFKKNQRGDLKGMLTDVAKLYSGSLETYGLTSKSVGWKDEASQILRFEKLSTVIEEPVADNSIMINDFGCGYGAFFHYLDNRLGPRIKRYFGYEISSDMIAAGQNFVKDHRAEFIFSPRVTQIADYSFASGTFNVKLKADNKFWTEYIMKILLNLSAMSKKGFAFNALSTYVDWKEDHLFYADPLVFFDFCKTKISRYVSLLHDYPLFEWTMTVRKEDISK